MQPIQSSEFAALMNTLRACYQAGIRDETLWQASLRAYWERMRDLDPAAVRKAFAVAWRRYPSYFPTAAQLVELAQIATRNASPPTLGVRRYESPSPESRARAERIVADVGRKLAGLPPLDGSRYAWEEYE